MITPNCEQLFANWWWPPSFVSAMLGQLSKYKTVSWRKDSQSLLVSKKQCYRSLQCKCVLKKQNGICIYPRVFFSWLFINFFQKLHLKRLSSDLISNSIHTNLETIWQLCLLLLWVSTSSIKFLNHKNIYRYRFEKWIKISVSYEL